MRKSDYISLDSNKISYGNFEAHIAFLDIVELLHTDAKILEIGCGKGPLLNHLRKLGYDIIGVDIDRNIVNQGRYIYGDLPAFLGSGEALPFKNTTFDIILSFDLFEHIRNCNMHLREVYRVLKYGGYYLLATPNKWTNMTFEPIRFTKKFGVRNAFRFLNDHCSLHDYWQLKNRIEEHKFEVKFYDIQVVNDFFQEKMENFLGLFGLLLLEIINPDRFPIFLRPSFYVEARKI